MNTNKKNKNLLFAFFSIVSMIGSGTLLNWTINNLYGTSSALITISLALLSVFIYILGASLMGRSINKVNSYNFHGGLNNGIVFAFLLIAAGALMLCFNTEMLNPIWKSFFLSWPMLLFVIGSISICKLHFIPGFLFAAAGKFFLIEKASDIYPNDIQFAQFTSTYWPALIIIFGILILLCVIIRPGQSRRRCHKENYTSNENKNNEGEINYQFVFSGTEQVILDPVFKGGRIDVTFGGMELDLRRTSLAEGDTFLSINATLGGVEITAPDNWNIEIQAKSTIGGVTDSRVKNVEKDLTRKLIIVATCTLGGIEIK